MKKVIHKLFILIIGTIAVLCPCGNAFAIENVSNPDGGINVPTPYFRLLLNNSWTDWLKGDYNLGKNQFRIDQIRVSGDKSNTLGVFPYGRQTVYLRTQNCVFLDAAYKSGWSFEGVQIYNEKLHVANDYYDKPIAIYALTYRNNAGNVSSIDSAFNAHFYCTWDTSTELQPSIDVLTVATYPPTLSYTEQLNQIKSTLENIKNNSSNSAIIDQQQDFRDQDKSDMQDAQGDASTSGDDSASEANSQGQTLLQAFISFVQMLGNISPGSCSITLNTGYGFNLGNLDLCSISPPSSFQIISSLVAIGFFVPLSLACGRKIIELFRSFQT